MKRAILDTDVGTDVDDALALALIAASPELQVEGVTTVHADAPLRARIARMLLSLAGCGDIPVIPGASTPLEEPLPEPFHWGPHLWGHGGVGILSSRSLSLQTIWTRMRRPLPSSLSRKPRHIQGSCP
jgi:purine nucleosidase